MTTSASGTQAGREYSLTCSVNGIDDPSADITIMWIAQNSSVVSVTNMGKAVALRYDFIGKLADAGEYTCMASIAFHNQESLFNLTSKITITVKSKSVEMNA